MRIVAAELHLVRLNLVHEFRTSSHAKDHLEHILIRLVDESGAVGWGEIASSPDPYFNAENTASCWMVAHDYLLPAVLGAKWDNPAELTALWNRVRGNYFAKAGIDVAAWDLWSRTNESSLSVALGGIRREVTAGVSLGIEPTIDELLAQVEKQVGMGYHRIKLKIAPGWDIEPVRAVRDAYPKLDVHVDANAAYTEAPEHLAALRGFDAFGLTMIEQPFAARDLLAHSRLQQSIETPICLDESIEQLADLELALSIDAIQVLNIKVSRMGGLSPALAAHDRAREAGLPGWCGGMHEFGIGRAANVALSSLAGFVLPSDVSGSEKYYARDILTTPIAAVDGIVKVPSGPGLGFTVDSEFLAKNRHKYAELSVR